MKDDKLGVSHCWGDDFDWKGLDAAAYYIQSNCRRWARMGIWTKEKYGTLRISLTCAYFMEYDFIHHIFYPGHAYYRLPKWFRTYIDWPVGKVLKAVGIVWLVQTYQTAVLKHFWNKAAKKWPHIAEEILDEYEWVLDEKPSNGEDS